MKKKIWTLLIVIALLVVAILMLWRELSFAKKNSALYVNHLEQLTGIGRLGSTHIHADFKVYINGEEIKIYQEKNLEKNKFTHMHPGKDDEDVIHVHATGITLKQFFNTKSKTMKYYVNNKLNDEAPDHEINDLDKILISYGDESQAEIQKQLASIGNKACIQSKK